ncbi:6,7-dimethyl-8-ribityllumazine synthase [Salinispirillum sp. LH 10-3-1]|uniref:6,7-dimethyl-8-ribityllumazine synthase n=1 Tax=Salinispirillum sp. LH 10-3-1 TaxID=2952525 RepID=A0AB38YD66_9GAMM
MNQFQNTPSTPHNASNSTGRIAVISASWHADIVGQARQSLVETLDQSAVSLAVDEFAVPGAFEIPLHAKRLAETGRYDAIVALGLVVNGGIYRHDFVATAVIDGLMRVQLDTDVPVFSVVLTPHDFHGHEEHVKFYREHFVKKGQEAAHAVVQTLKGLETITELS